MDAYGVSPSSSSSDCEEYDVFLSFRGEDVRNNFLSHLRAALKQKQIKTFFDEDSLEMGDEINLALPEAIEKSKISIIIFSKNYASSTWCLRELEHILKCRREKKQMVIPIFYEIDPARIRHQRRSYHKAFLKHEDRFKDNMEMVKKWRDALKESADLSGRHSQGTGPEAELIKAIVEDVLRKLKRVPSSAICCKELIGIEERIQKIEQLLTLGSPDIRIVGIWGMGGLGKTTIAGVVYNKHFNQFESYRFLANVREESGKLGGLIKLRDELLGHLLEEGNLSLGSPFLPPYVSDRLRRKKVLIVLDDVNDSEQLRVLVGDRNWFGHGSRIIITTRDATVLTGIEADGIQEIKELNYDEAFRLFKLIAFTGNSPSKDHIELSKEVVKYAGGIPLAINILASHLRSLPPQAIGDWEEILDSFKDVSHDRIEKTLKISYDGLNTKEKAIFLDIACFFKGERRELVENVLNGCGFGASIRINDLVNKSLITVDSYNNTLWMHDLVQEMGWKIVRQQSDGQPGEQSRLWIAKDVYRVLKNNEGTKKIEGIFLDMAKINKELHLSAEVFEKMSKLRLLKIYNTIVFDDCDDVKRNKVQLRQDLQFLPDTLRYLHWEGYPSKQLPPDFEPQNLVVMNLPYSQLEQLSNDVLDFENLKSINLRRSVHLTQFPDFSHSPKLENINLEGSTSLLQVSSQSVQDLHKLTYLNLSHCSKLQFLPMITSLTSLNLSSTAVEYLPSSIGSLKTLSKLSLNDCTRLANLPSSVNSLNSLKYLELHGCSNLETFPELPWNIEKLDIRGTAIKEVASSSIENRFRLKKIDLSNCDSLMSLPTSIFEMRSLADLYLYGCSKLKTLPEISEPNKILKSLQLGRTRIEQLPSLIGHLIGVKSLAMENRNDLEFVPSSISNMVGLRELELSHCQKLQYLPEISERMEGLYRLHLEGTRIRQLPSSIDFLCCHLQCLYLTDSDIIEIPASIKSCSSLTELYINNCKNLHSLPELPLSLLTLDASGCVSLEVVSNSKRALTQEFWVYGRPKLFAELLGFSDCSNLDTCERHNIAIDFQLRALRTAMRFMHTKSNMRWEPQVSACCPGYEIPRWFEYQWEGCCINTKLPQQWHNSNFLGFAACVVVDSYSDTNRLNLLCEFNLKSNQGIIPKFTSSFFDYKLGSTQNLPTTSNSGNTYMWFRGEDFCECLDVDEASFDDVDEASFDFSLQEYDASNKYWIESSKCEVRKCGIHMLYRKDLDEFGLNFINAD